MLEVVDQLAGPNEEAKKGLSKASFSLLNVTLSKACITKLNFGTIKENR